MTAWTDAVKKTFHMNRKTNKSYQFKNALIDAKKIYKKGSGVISDTASKGTGLVRKTVRKGTGMVKKVARKAKRAVTGRKRKGKSGSTRKRKTASRRK